MKFRLPLLLLPLLGLAASLRADGPYLGGFDAVPLLPPPPALHSPEDIADRDSTFRIYSARTPGDVARGKAEHKVTLRAFAPFLAPGFDPARYPRLVALIKDLDAEAKAAADTGKYHWKRPRPFVLDPARFSEPGDPEKTPGYPSAHSTRGTLFALVLAEVFPENREAILAKGRLVGWTRVEIGSHTPLDVYAGRVLGQAMARALMANPAFQADLAAVKAEAAAQKSAVPAGS